ncbi:unnamed protein product, partial [Gadus morhua 'NCC']
ALERRVEESGRRYSVEGEVLLPGVLGSRVLGLMEDKTPLWSSALRLKYGVGEEARHLRQECYMSQSLRREATTDISSTMRAEHEFHCSNTASVNHKIVVRNEESHSHHRSSLDASYGKHWDEVNNKRKLHLSQSFKNQTSQNHTSYTMELSLLLPEKHLNYRTHLLHSHLRERGSESTTHLKVHYNDLLPLVASLQWRSPPGDAAHRKWEGSFNMDTPWLYVFMAHKLSLPQSHTLQLSAELSARKWLRVNGLALEALYKDCGREREARLHLYTPTLAYVKVVAWGVVGKQGVKSSWTLSSMWTLPLQGQLSLEGSRDRHGLQLVSSYGRQNLSLSAALNTLDKNLKKSQVVVKMVFWEPKSFPTELEFEGSVEELKKDPRMYQKTAVLLLRQPFKNFPQSLLLRHTFTVDHFKDLYILESRAGFHSSGEVIHTLTLGYKPPRPFVRSALVHPFSSYMLPTDSELCLTMFNNQTQREVQGRLRVGSKEKINFNGQLLQKPGQRGMRVRANLTHILQLQLPSSVLLEGEVHWTPPDSNALDYLARGRLRVERQESQFSLHLNGTTKVIGLYSSLSHPFKSKIPKTVEVTATLYTWRSGRGFSGIHVVADGKDRARLGAKLSHSLSGGDRAVGLKLNLSQSLFPRADLALKLTANLSEHWVSVLGSYTQGERALLLKARGLLTHTQGLQLSVTGDLRHSLVGLSALPTALGLEGALGKTEGLTEGQLRLHVMEALYLVEFKHIEEHGHTRAGYGDEEKEHEEDEDDTAGDGPGCRASYRLYAQYGDQFVCLNASRQLNSWGNGVLHANLSHSSDLLSARGFPANNSAKVSWTNQRGLQASLLAELLAGPEGLRAELSWARMGRQAVPRWELHSRLQHQSGPLAIRGLPSSMQADAHYQREEGRVLGDLVLHIEEQKKLDARFIATRKNNTANVSVSLWQQIQQPREVLPTSLQMNCTSDSSTDRFLGQCYGSLVTYSVETPTPREFFINGLVLQKGCATSLNTQIQAMGEEKARLSLSLECHPHLSLRGSVQHSMEAAQMQVVPTHGALVLAFSAVFPPGGLELGLDLGQCHFRSLLGQSRSHEMQKSQSAYSFNVSQYCPALQRTLLPVSSDVHGYLSMGPCQLTLAGALRLEDLEASIDLEGQTCRPVHLSGALTHSFPKLRSRGLPLRTTVEASGPGAPGETADLLIRSGSCHLGVKALPGAKGRVRWLWAMESKCPFLQARLNGSVTEDSQGVWTAMVDTGLGNEQGFLRLSAWAAPELRVEGQLRQNMSVLLLHEIPGHARLSVSAGAGQRGYAGQALLHIGQCTLGVTGGILPSPGLQGSVVYYNNCTVVQKWGSPDRVQFSGSVVTSRGALETGVSMVLDKKTLQASLVLIKTKYQCKVSVLLNNNVPLLKMLGLPSSAAMAINSGNHGDGSYYYLQNCSAGNQQFTKKMTVTMSSADAGINSSFIHTVNFLRALGVPENNSIQMELSSGKEKTLNLQSQLGRQQAVFRLKIKGLSQTTELTGTMWSSGPPNIIEGLCSVKRGVSGFQSQARLAVDGHKVLATGFNVSVVDGNLAMLLSFNQPNGPALFETALTAHFKGPLRSLSADVRVKGARVSLLGDIGELGPRGGSIEARLTLKHSLDGKNTPVFQVEAWGRLTESQLKCSMAVNPALGSSLALIIQGHRLLHSKELMVKVVQNIPQLMFYLPGQLNTRTQVNHSSSRVASVVELSSGRRRLLARCELVVLQGGYMQAMELNHTFPQLKPLPRAMAVRTLFEAKNWSHQIQHGTVWGNREIRLTGVYSVPPSLEIGNHVLK